MYNAIDTQSLDQKLGNNSLIPLRGIEEEMTGKSYIWVRDWRKKTNIAISDNDQKSDRYRYGLERWVRDRELFGSYEAADQFYERAFSKLLPSEKPEKVHAFVERVGELYSRFAYARADLNAKIPKRFLYNALSEIFRFHMIELAFIGIGLYYAADSFDADFTEHMRLARLVFGTAVTVIVAKGAASTLGERNIRLENLR